MDNLRICTIKMIYNDRKSRTLAEARAATWNVMEKKSFCRLPPDEDTHSLHSERVNYLCFINFNYMRRGNLPSPKEYGWTTKDGKCYPLRYRQAALPNNIFEMIKQSIR